MRDNAIGLHTLVLPFGALPGSPHRVLGDSAPPELVAYFANDFAVGGYTIVHADLWYFDGGDYYWVVLLHTAGPDAFTRAQPSGFTISGTVFLSEINDYATSGGIYGPANVRMSYNPAGDPYEWNFGGPSGTQFGAGIFIGTSVDIQVGFQEPSGEALTSLPRGLRSWAASQSSTAAITAETAVLTGTPMTAVDGRAYRMKGGSHNSSSAGGTRIFRLRKNTVAGAVILGTFDLSGTIAGWQEFEQVFINVSGSDVDFDPCLTMMAGAGNVTQGGFAALPRYLRIFDEGDATKFPNAAVIT